MILRACPGSVVPESQDPQLTGGRESFTFCSGLVTLKFHPVGCYLCHIQELLAMQLRGSGKSTGNVNSFSNPHRAPTVSQTPGKWLEGDSSKCDTIPNPLLEEKISSSQKEEHRRKSCLH